MRQCRGRLAFLFLLLETAPVAGAELQVQLTILAPPTQQVGITVPFVAFPINADPAKVVYRFEVARPEEPFRIVRDFARYPFGEWTPLEEGTYQIRATGRETETLDQSEVVATYSVLSRIVGTGPVISATPNALVALFSVPPCDEGDTRIRFWEVGTPTLFSQTTPAKACKPGVSLNFYVAGMRAQTTYFMRHESASEGTIVEGPLLFFRSGAPPDPFPLSLVRAGPGSGTSLSDSILLHSVIWRHDGKPFPVATDLLGRILWYYNPGAVDGLHTVSIMRPVPGGTFLLIANRGFLRPHMLREIDVAGNTLRETDARRISVQLLSQGQPWISSFHHEALRLPNGHTVVLGSVEEVLTDVQGPGAVTVLGDMIIELDEDWQVVWSWNAFDHLDPQRKAVLGETCSGPRTGCPLVLLSEEANDWLHSNSITYLPEDGNLLLSVRNQDWILKIDFRDGQGTGRILWRLGPEGDFTLDSEDPFPWFSHQHDVRVDGTKLIVYDNGNTRRAQDPQAHSRGQVYDLNEATLEATLELNVDLGHYASAVGSAQKLENGNYHFLSGTRTPGLFAYSVEVEPGGAISYALETVAVTYRAFRMQNLYTPE